MNRRELLKGMTGCMALPAAAGFFESDNLAEGKITRRDAPKTPWKWSKEASFYEKKGGRTECLICPNHCELAPGDRSACRVKVNINGTAYTLAYGNPCSMNVDPIEKKPLFHFYPQSTAFSLATAGCNLRCLNCQNWEISQKKPEEVASSEMFPDQVVAAAERYQCGSIAYTYSEPIAYYEYMADIAEAAKKKGIRNVWISNGYISRAALEPLTRLIDGANINLKAFSEETYCALNGGHLKHVLATLQSLRESPVWFEVTTLMVPTYTDDEETVKGVAGWILKNLGPDVPLHFSRFYPKHKLDHLPPTDIDKLIRAQETARRMGLHYVYAGNVPGMHLENTFCPGCGKIVIERDGFAVKQYKIDAKSRCGFCRTKIAGRF